MYQTNETISSALEWILWHTTVQVFSIILILFQFQILYTAHSSVLTKLVMTKAMSNYSQYHFMLHMCVCVCPKTCHQWYLPSQYVQSTNQLYSISTAFISDII